MALRINIGCGQTPTPGWRNFDNSLSLRLSKIPFLPDVLLRLGLVDDHQYGLMLFCRNNDVEYGDATKRFPLGDGSADVIYSSHMLEHLDRDEVKRFLPEAFRLLRPGGIIRLAVPDLKHLVGRYIETGDADAFIEATCLCVPRPRSIAQRLRLLMVGPRHHQWMYDGNSLCRLLRHHGFVNPTLMPAGQTTIAEHEPLDLAERASESVYVEARKPPSPLRPTEAAPVPLRADRDERSSGSSNARSLMSARTSS